MDSGRRNTADLDCRVPAVPKRLVALRRSLADWATRIGMAASTVEELVLATYEALANAVEHAYRGPVRGLVELRACSDLAHGVVTITVSDFGRWRPAPADRGTRGRGLLLIHNLTSSAEVIPTSHGTTVRMTWRVPASKRSHCPD